MSEKTEKKATTVKKWCYHKIFKFKVKIAIENAQMIVFFLYMNVCFIYKIQIAADRQYGAEQDDGTWNGMIADVRKLNENVQQNKYFCCCSIFSPRPAPPPKNFLSILKPDFGTFVARRTYL